MIRVFVVDDHPIIREGLRQLIDAEADMQMIGDAADGDTAIAEAVAGRATVIVLDLSAIGRSGVDMVSALHAALPGVRIAVFTRHSDPALVRQVFAAGALAYVLKQSATRELLAAIRAASLGRQYLDVALRDTYGNGIAPAVTDRESSVLRLAALGHTQKEIATQLGIVEKTVEVHKGNAMRKLALARRTDLIRYAALQGWLSSLFGAALALWTLLTA